MDNQNTGKLNVNQNGQSYQQPGQYNYNQQNYGGYTPYGGGMPPKKNNNTVVIILAAVLGVLLCVLIAVSVLFFINSDKSFLNGGGKDADVVDTIDDVVE